ncbi:TIGR02679 domain-containing protein [Actinoallomurus sp. NBC_01490]|uniref:TIGR02679 domain-containing protein n=1 Tax=Actinoallomurus sp. NBC_01490 TaxID=2903557 RepID=UPI002E37994B|nr:TIGR02679 domain-containing protein [Actinoallomurus sp. NBC_01490]
MLDDTGRRRRGSSAVSTDPAGATVQIRRLTSVLNLAPADLVPLTEQAVGKPIINRAHQRQHASARRRDLWDYATRTLHRVPGLVARLRAAGVAEDDTATRFLIDGLAYALDRLPAHPPVSLPKLAHDCTGDPHYFDLDTLNGARLVTAIAELASCPEPTRPDLIRALLLRHGVIADRLSATVLLHRVNTIGDGPIDRRLRDSPNPVPLTLLDLTLTPPTFAPDQTLTIVENPSVLEAALLLPDPPPLACTSGQLGSVDHALLQLATDQNIPLRYAGDLDDHGLRIAANVTETYGAKMITYPPSSTGNGTRPTPPPHHRAGSDGDDQEPATTNADRGITPPGGRAAIFQEHDELLRAIFDHRPPSL